MGTNIPAFEEYQQFDYFQYFNPSISNFPSLFLFFNLQGPSFYEKNFAKFGRVFKTHLFLNPTVRVHGPDNIAKILQGENDIVTSTVSVYLAMFSFGEKTDDN